MLDIKALEQALETIGMLGRGELTFTVNGLPVTMRMLTAAEDITANKYAREVSAEEPVEEVRWLKFLESYKQVTLSHAIIQVGDLDLRDVEYVATGETTDKGVPSRVAKDVAVRKIIDGWSRMATMSLFQKYQELVHRVDADADRAVQFNPQDLDTEIERVEKRLADLKQERERSIAARSGNDSSVLGKADVLVHQRTRDIQAAAANQAPIVAPDTVAPEPVVRSRVAPPVVAAPPPPLPQVQRPVAPPNPAPAVGFDGMMDSLGESPEALAMETVRLQTMREQARRASLDAAQQSMNEAEQNTIPGGPGRRRPPHHAAANLADAVVDLGGSSIEGAHPTAPMGDREGFRLGTATLLDRVKPQPDRKVSVNAQPKDGPTNPRFRPPR